MLKKRLTRKEHQHEGLSIFFTEISFSVSQTVSAARQKKENQIKQAPKGDPLAPALPHKLTKIPKYYIIFKISKRKNSMKRILRLISALLLLPVLIVSLASCGKDSKDKLTGFIYEIVDDSITITGYSGLESHITIPDKIKGLPVTAVAENAFKGMINLEKVTLPDSVTTIDYAFTECPQLTSVSLGSGIISMNGAFKDCQKLVTVTGGENAIELAEAYLGCISLLEAEIPRAATNCISTFKNCSSLVSVTINEGITELPYTFSGCTSLKEISIPSTVNTAMNTFKDCSSLTTVNGAEYLTSLDNTFNGCVSLSSLTLGNDVKMLSGAFVGCSSLTLIENLPSEVEAYSPSFTGCTNLSDIVIPKMPEKDLTSYIFITDIEGCHSVKNVTVNSQITFTAEFCKTFSGCTLLESITVPDDVALDFLRVDSMYTDSIFIGTDAKVSSAVSKSKKASNIRITEDYGFIEDKSYTHIYGGDVNAFDPERIESEASVIGFESFTKSYYWCGYPKGTDRRNNTIAIEREYSFYLRVTGENDGTLPSSVTVNGMHCIIEGE